MVFANLIELTLDGNQIEDLSDLTKFTKLQHLEISRPILEDSVCDSILATIRGRNCTVEVR